jgi:hypothetical protein
VWNVDTLYLFITALLKSPLRTFIMCMFGAYMRLLNVQSVCDISSNGVLNLPLACVYVISENEDGKSRALDNLGRVYARMGKFEKAIEVYVIVFFAFFSVPEL